MRKKIKKISALVVLGMLILMVYIPISFGAPSWDSGVSSNTSYYVAIDADNNQTDQAFGVFKDGIPGSGTELFRIQEDGKVGIGTTNPQTKLEVLAPVAEGGATITTAHLRLGKYSDASGPGVIGYYVPAGNSATIEFPAGENELNILGGNVGIGTTSPIGKIHVVETGGGYAGYFDAGPSGGISKSMPVGVAAVADDGIAIVGHGPGTLNLDNLAAYLGTSHISVVGGNVWWDGIGCYFEGRKYSGYFNEADVIIMDGNLGIRTESPSQTLHVQGNARITGALYDSNNDPGTSGQILQTTGSGIDWVDASSISDGDWIIIGNDMYSGVPGNVGIGTIAPVTTLDINGGLATSTITVFPPVYNVPFPSTDFTILVDATAGPVTINLLSAALVDGQILVIKKIDTSPNPVTIVPIPPETIDGMPMLTWNTPYTSYMIQADTTNPFGPQWYII